MALKRYIGIIAAAAMLTVCSVSCGDSDDEDGSGIDLPKDSYANVDPFNSFDKAGAYVNYPEGSYAKIGPMDGNYTAYKSSIDAGINYAISSYRNFETKPLTFTDGSFEMNTLFFNAKDYTTYDGTFTVDNGKILFSYENCHTENYDVNINDDPPEVDRDIIINKRNAEALKGLSKDEQDERIKEEQLLLGKNNIKDVMEKFNNSGTYFARVAPSLFFSDKTNDYAALPLFIGKTFTHTNINPDKDSIEMLSVIDDYLCVPTYGFHLNGSYSQGKSFSITYNMLNTYLEDPDSAYYIQDWENMSITSDMTQADQRKGQMIKFFGDLNDTKIEFSGGQWTWTNSEGELLNNGTYLEGSEHEGIIGMFIDDNSRKNDSIYKMLCPLLFYIDDDGTIWYPGFVKMN